MHHRQLPSQEYLLECLDYNPDTGRLFWRHRPPRHFIDTPRQSASHTQSAWNGAYAGKEAFTATSSNGYATGGLDKVIYRAHRIIWMMVYGTEPDDTDHTDGDRRNNRLSNLRSVTRQQNMQNARVRSNNTSGATGVSWSKRGKWVAQIKAEGRVRFIGHFATFEAALAARRFAEIRYGFHPNHGRAA